MFYFQVSRPNCARVCLARSTNPSSHS
jgi:hypothetical protein